MSLIVLAAQVLVGFLWLQEASANPSSWGNYQGPILVHILGGDARPKDMLSPKVCEIKFADLDTKRKARVSNALLVAKKAATGKGFHIAPQIPSETIWAVTPEKDLAGNAVFPRYLLYKNYQAIQYQQGKEADFLIKMVRTRCNLK